MTATPDEAQDLPHPRIAALVAHFREIGLTRVKGLPIYNPRIEVEAVGFAPFGKGWIGALITPWFMATLILPQDRLAVDEDEIGKKCREVLPCGECAFSRGGDHVVGAYKTRSIRSAMSEFASQDTARVEALRVLSELLSEGSPAPNK
jgi:[NiFe] hydrogenase assembly HybE family chaperone